jgi:hypothetical protein
MSCSHSSHDHYGTSYHHHEHHRRALPSAVSACCESFSVADHARELERERDLLEQRLRRLEREFEDLRGRSVAAEESDV